MSLTGSNGDHRSSLRRVAYTPTGLLGVSRRATNTQKVPDASTAATGRNRSTGSLVISSTTAGPAEPAGGRSWARKTSPRSGTHSIHVVRIVPSARATIEGRAAFADSSIHSTPSRGSPARLGAVPKTTSAPLSCSAIRPWPSSTHMYRNGSGSRNAPVAVTSRPALMASLIRRLKDNTRSRSACCCAVYSPEW